MLKLAALAACAAAAVAAAVSASCLDPLQNPPLRVDPSTGVFVDACGRQRYFRGINSVVKTQPYFPDPHTYAPGGRTLSPEDAGVWQSIGLNIVRLGHMWAGVQPGPGRGPGGRNDTYAQILANLSSALLINNGIYTLADKHQDLFSSAFCADGAPTWLAREYAAAEGADPFPAPLFPACAYDNATGDPAGDCCGQAGWSEFYLTSAAGKSFQHLYTTAEGHSDAGDFWDAVLAAYAMSPARGLSLLAAELLNEPWSGDALSNPLLMVPGVADAVNLQPFYGNVTLRFRAAEAALGMAPHVISVEPVTWDNWFPAGFTSLPGPAEDGLSSYSYHYYALPDVVGSAGEIEDRAADARRYGAAAMLTEFDIDLASPVVAPYTYLDLRATLDACDRVQNGYIGWAWESAWNGSSLASDVARELSRPFPLAVAGTNASFTTYAFTVDNATWAPRFVLSYRHSAAVGSAAPTEVFLSTGMWFPPSTLSVNVTSSPPGAVVFSVRRVDGAQVVGAGGGGGADPYALGPMPPGNVPLAYAIVTVSTAPGWNGVAADVTLTAVA